MEQHITRVSEAEAVGGAAIMARRWRWSTLQHSGNGSGLARAASTVHSLRRTSMPDPFPAGERFDQAIEDRMS